MTNVIFDFILQIKNGVIIGHHFYYLKSDQGHFVHKKNLINN